MTLQTSRHASATRCTLVNSSSGRGDGECQPQSGPRTPAQQHAAHKSTHTNVLNNIILNRTTCVNYVARSRIAQTKRRGCRYLPITAHAHDTYSQHTSQTPQRCSQACMDDTFYEKIDNQRLTRVNWDGAPLRQYSKTMKQNVIAHKHVTNHTCPCWHRGKQPFSVMRLCRLVPRVVHASPF